MCEVNNSIWRKVKTGVLYWSISICREQFDLLIDPTAKAMLVTEIHRYLGYEHPSEKNSLNNSKMFSGPNNTIKASREIDSCGIFHIVNLCAGYKTYIVVKIIKITVYRIIDILIQFIYHFTFNYARRQGRLNHSWGPRPPSFFACSIQRLMMHKQGCHMIFTLKFPNFSRFSLTFLIHFPWPTRSNSQIAAIKEMVNWQKEHLIFGNFTSK